MDESTGGSATVLPDGRLNECCPECGYSLVASPAEGVCPECGQAYDQTAMVLYGGVSGFGAHPATARRGSLIWAAWTPLMGVWLIAQRWPTREPEEIWLTAAWALLILGSGLLLASRLAAVGPGPLRLRLGPEGCSLRTAHGGSVLWHVAMVVVSAAMGAFLVGYLVVLVARPALGVSGAMWAALAGSSVFPAWTAARLARRWWREGPDALRDTQDYTVAWPGARVREFKEVGPSAYRFRLRAARRRWRLTGEIDLVIACSAAQAKRAAEYVAERIRAAGPADDLGERVRPAEELARRLAADGPEVGRGSPAAS